MSTLGELISKLHSPHNEKVLEAIVELRERGWLTDGTLERNSLMHVHLERADLSGAILRKVDLHQARLDSAILSGADLTDAKLTRAKLRGSNLEKAILDGTDLYKVDFSGAHHLTWAQLSRAKRLYGAILPDGGTYDGRFNLPGDLDFARWGKIDPDDPVAMAEFFGVSLETYLEGQKAALNELA